MVIFTEFSNHFINPGELNDSLNDTLTRNIIYHFYIVGTTNDSTKHFILKSLQNDNVGITDSPLKLDVLSPHRLQYDF